MNLLNKGGTTQQILLNNFFNVSNLLKSSREQVIALTSLFSRFELEVIKTDETQKGWMFEETVFVTIVLITLLEVGDKMTKILTLRTAE